MNVLQGLQPQKVFAFFEEISAVPRGSGNRKGIADYTEAFARARGLRVVRDEADNVIIYKDGVGCAADAAPLILQGHLDMVCQRDADCAIDFERDGLSLYVDGDDIRARGTTLGADNGIAAAMMLAVLDSDDIVHPPLEAVFTSDEEIGMLGAAALDMSLLTARRMINLDAEEDDTVTVSCAGGCDVSATVELTREAVEGTAVRVAIRGLLGGHSGVEIDKGRTNANKLMGHLLTDTASTSYRLLAIRGGDKVNAIPAACEATLCVADAPAFVREAAVYLETVKAVLADSEPQFEYDVEIGESGEYHPMVQGDALRVLSLLCATPDGVVDMSREIDGLVETSLNLGVLQTEADSVRFGFALRSSNAAALDLLEKTLCCAMNDSADAIQASGHYPPWEYRAVSPLRDAFVACYTAGHGVAPKVEAIHAGLECAVFASRIPDLDCIACGPSLADVHTTSERLSIRSAAQTYELLKEMLRALA